MEVFKSIISTGKQNGYFDGFLCEHDIEMINITLSNCEIIKLDNVMIKDCNCQTLTAYCAVNGYLSYLKYLHKLSLAGSEQSLTKDKNKYLCDEWVYANAACGQLECLKYLHEQSLTESENRCPWSIKACRKAAKGHLECLIYLHENGCPWDEKAIDNATRGHLDCLKYIHENGCRFHEDSNVYASAANGHLECLEYLYSVGYNFGPHYDVLCDFAVEVAAYGHLDCLKFLHEHGCRWNADAYLSAITYFPNKLEPYPACFMDCLKYLVENECPWSANLCSHAVRNDNIIALKYLCEKGYLWNKENCILLAESHPDCLAYLKSI